MKRIAAVAAFLAVSLAHATTIKPMSVEQLTQTAGMVVEAHALTSWSQWNREHTIIFTYTRFQVVRTLKGRSGQQIVVKQPGGEVPPYGQRIPGVRQFQPGEDTVLFLRPSVSGDGSLAIVGLMQGNFRVYRARNGAVSATNGVAGVHELHQGSLRVYSGAVLPLDELESRVQGAEKNF